MTRILSAVLAAAALAAVAANTGSTPLAKRAACTAQEGRVEGWLTRAGHSCPGAIAVYLALFKTETVRTGNPGQLTFHTSHIYRCIELSGTAGSADVILPTPAIALRHVRGRTWCHRRRGDAGKTLTAVGAVIHTSGTIFGIDSTPKGSLIKASEGSVVVVATASRQRLTLRAGRQAAIPTNGQLAFSRPLDLDPLDKQAVFFLHNNILSMGPTQPAEYLKARRETKVVLIAENASIAKSERARLPGVRVTTLTAAQANSDPGALTARVSATGAGTVLVAGDFDHLQPTLHNVVAALPPEIAILFAYVPT
jgi:hypothetical protein